MRLAPRQPCERESRAGSLQSGVACRILVTMARTAGFKAGPVLLELLLWLCDTLVGEFGAEPGGDAGRRPLTRRGKEWRLGFEKLQAGLGPAPSSFSSAGSFPPPLPSRSEKRVMPGGRR